MRLEIAGMIQPIFFMRSTTGIPLLEVDQAVKTEGVQNADVSRTAHLCHLRNGRGDGGQLTDARLPRSAELISPLPLLQSRLDEFFDDILAMESCIGGKPGIDHSSKFGRIAVWT
jgi:hypothetical protein